MRESSQTARAQSAGCSIRTFEKSTPFFHEGEKKKENFIIAPARRDQIVDIFRDYQYLRMVSFLPACRVITMREKKMIKTACLFLWASLAVALAGCPAPGVSAYPMRVPDIGESADYPAHAAGFERGGILSYALANIDVSVGYNMLTPEAQIASTIYVSDPSVFPEVRQAEDPLAALFELVKSGVQQYHPGALLLGEDSVTLVKNGREYRALRAVFRFEGEFMGRRQPLYSVLMLWRHGDDFVKLRSTTPYAQRHLSESNNMKLLEAVNWTARPF